MNRDWIYGTHQPSCVKSKIMSCNCGLAAALEALKKLDVQ